MKEIIHFPGSLDAPRDFVDGKGDVKHIFDDPELSADEEDLSEALEERDADYLKDDPAIPQELRDLLAEIDERIQRLKSYGASDAEINGKLGREYGPPLARLAAHGVDMSTVPLPIFIVDSHDAENSDEAPVLSLSPEEERERKIEDYMDKRGVSRAEAERSI